MGTIRGNEKVNKIFNLLKNFFKDNSKYTDKKNKFNKLFVNMFSGTYLIFAIIILLASMHVFIFKQTPRILFVALIYFILFRVFNYIIMSYFTEEDRKKIDCIFYIGLTLMAILMTVSGYLILFKNDPSTDIEKVDEVARTFANTGKFTFINCEREYFIRYENNRFYALFLSAIYYLVHMILGRVPTSISVWLGTISITLSVLFMYKIAKKVFGIRVALLSFVITFLSLMWYVFVAYTYTDTLSMPFLMISIYYFIKMMEDGTFKKKVLYFFISSVLLYLGYAMKGNVIIAFVAFAMYIFFKKNWKKSFAYILACIVIFMMLGTAITKVSNKSKLTDPKLSDAYKFPLSHWVMMGLSSYKNYPLEGNYSSKDCYNTKCQPTLKDKKEYNKKVIKERLNNLGVMGFAKHSYKKLQAQWSDGTFQYRFFIGDPGGIPLKENSYRDFLMGGGHNRYDGEYKRIGDKEDTSFLICQGYQLCILAVFVGSIILGFLRKEIDFALMINILMFGLALFLLIWESMPRYIINFIPIMIMSTASIINVRYNWFYKNVILKLFEKIPFFKKKLV